ncbi:uncharacterized protein BDV17DRAFT_284571 [Aspergillus undulatus]|uniref:uncharacterized protein n=1 Tax=Aspergillus undulatus TaxID=1810928 RepID=UPI003CCCC4E5
MPHPDSPVNLEEDAENPSRVNPFASYLVGGSFCFVDDLARKIIPERLSRLRQIHQLVVNESCPLYRVGREFQKKHEVPETSFQNWKELLCGWLEFPVILLLNPSPFDVLGYEQMVQQSPTLGWMEKSLEVMKLGLRDVIVMDMFPMVTVELLKTKREDWFELVADSFEVTLTCLRYIRPEILISCQCSSKTVNQIWQSFENLKAEELSSSEAGARQELVKTVDVDGHEILVVQGVHPQNVVQYNQEMERVLKKLFTKVLGPFGQWKERRVAERREAARREVILAKEGVRDGMRVLIKQMQLFEQICGQDGRNRIELLAAAKRVEEWRKQIEGWAGEMDD